MVQARRRSPKRKSTNSGQPTHGLSMLIVGMVIGSLATVLWQGMRRADSGVGSGIRNMIEQSKLEDLETNQESSIREEDKPVKQQTNYDFYTVLPEIEVVVPSAEVESPSEASEASTAQKTVSSENEISDGSAYMLQAGSYQNKADADRLKAELAFKGLTSVIQKVSIQDRGDFYRVRLGPFSNHEQMVKADNSLASQGIKALRLKISKGG